MKILTFALVLGAIACIALAKADSPSAKIRAEQSLLRLHQAELEAHRRTDWKPLLAAAQDGFIYIRDGKISRTNRADTRSMLEKYFKDATYQVYEDLEPPVVRTSEDGTMGWIISRTHAKRSQRDPATGKEEREEFVYAGITTYELKSGEWFRVANASTFEPPPQK